MLYSYYLLVKDSIEGLFVLTPHSRYAFDAMLSFGNYNHVVMIICVFLGSIIAVILNWLIGYKLRLIEKTQQVNKNSDGYQKFKSNFQKIVSPLLFLTFLPVFSGFITVLCGLFRVSLPKSLLFAGGTNLIYFLAKLY